MQGATRNHYWGGGLWGFLKTFLFLVWHMGGLRGFLELHGHYVSLGQIFYEHVEPYFVGFKVASWHLGNYFLYFSYKILLKWEVRGSLGFYEL